MGAPRRLTLEEIQADAALRSRDDSGVAAIAVGTVAWVFALVLVVTLGTSWGVDVDRWTLVCAIGALLGVLGLILVLRRRSRLSRAGANQE
jgi:predicted lysophospholipase L1 biosynthesis ABC-type transport system permease subunit